MNLIIDIGNTTVKCGIFDNHEQVDFARVDQEAKKLVEEWLQNYTIEEAILSASGQWQQEIQTFLEDKGIKVLSLTSSTPLPIKVVYDTPETLGRDRIAGMVGAWSLFPNQSSLVIDMGTCITTNVINKQGEFLGGTISPGVQMRARAMHEFTASLPLVDLELPKHFIGSSTETSMQNGIIRGTYFEIQTLIEQYIPVFDINNVILTGGDAKIFANLLNFKIFAIPNLVLTGLNEILLYNH